MSAKLPTDFSIKAAHHDVASYDAAAWELILSPSGVHLGQTIQKREAGLPQLTARCGELQPFKKSAQLCAEGLEAAKKWVPPKLDDAYFESLHQLIVDLDFMNLPKEVDPPYNEWSHVPFDSLAITIAGRHNRCMSIRESGGGNHVPWQSFRTIWSRIVSATNPPAIIWPQEK